MSTKYHATKNGIKEEEGGLCQALQTYPARREQHHPHLSQAKHPSHPSKLASSRLGDYFPVYPEKLKKLDIEGIIVGKRLLSAAGTFEYLMHKNNDNLMLLKADAQSSESKDREDESYIASTAMSISLGSQETETEKAKVTTWQLKLPLCQPQSLCARSHLYFLLLP